MGLFSFLRATMQSTRSPFGFHPAAYSRLVDEMRAAGSSLGRAFGGEFRLVAAPGSREQVVFRTDECALALARGSKASKQLVIKAPAKDFPGGTVALSSFVKRGEEYFPVLFCRDDVEESDLVRLRKLHRHRIVYYVANPSAFPVELALTYGTAAEHDAALALVKKSGLGIPEIDAIADRKSRLAMYHVIFGTVNEFFAHMDVTASGYVGTDINSHMRTVGRHVVTEVTCRNFVKRVAGFLNEQVTPEQAMRAGDCALDIICHTLRKRNIEEYPDFYAWKKGHLRSALNEHVRGLARCR